MVSWKNRLNSNRIPVWSWWIRFAKFCVITITRSVQIRPIVTGFYGTYEFYGAKKHPKHMGEKWNRGLSQPLGLQSKCRRFNSEAGFKRHYLPLPSCFGNVRRGEAWADSGKTQSTPSCRIGPQRCHTFRHCFGTHLLEDDVNIRVVQELMGHADVKTTEIWTHDM